MSAMRSYSRITPAPGFCEAGRASAAAAGGMAGLARTNEGRQRAKANGVKFGRKPALNTHQAEEARRMLKKEKTNLESAGC
jgi:hypothetical protein